MEIRTGLRYLCLWPQLRTRNPNLDFNFDFETSVFAACMLAALLAPSPLPAILLGRRLRAPRHPIPTRSRSAKLHKRGANGIEEWRVLGLGFNFDRFWEGTDWDLIWFSVIWERKLGLRGENGEVREGASWAEILSEHTTWISEHHLHLLSEHRHLSFSICKHPTPSCNLTLSNSASLFSQPTSSQIIFKEEGSYCCVGCDL